MVNLEWLIEQFDEFQNWNLQCFSSVNGQYQLNLMHCGDIGFTVESNLAQKIKSVLYCKLKYDQTIQFFLSEITIQNDKNYLYQSDG